MGSFDTVIIGAGAAGLFCASLAGQAGLSVLVLDNGKKAGRKILMSGGGRCNFTNMYIEPSAYLSDNPHFCKSALARYTQWDFIELVQKHHIAYHEKTLGQLFCDDSAQQIVDLLLAECHEGKVSIRLRSEVTQIEKTAEGFTLLVGGKTITASSVVIASGGLSMPGLGATPFGYKIAQQFGLNVLPTRAGLVPFTLHKPQLEQLSPLSGVAIPAIVTAENGTQFKENMSINLLPDTDLESYLQEKRQAQPNQLLKNTLSRLLPKRFIEIMIENNQLPDTSLAQLSNERITQITTLLQAWLVLPNGTEGYRTAEVTLGGVDTRNLSSKTMEATKITGLYFIGEVVDVTGWLGGYNFQWAWSSAYACAQALISRHMTK